MTGLDKGFLLKKKSDARRINCVGHSIFNIQYSIFKRGLFHDPLSSKFRVKAAI